MRAASRREARSRDGSDVLSRCPALATVCAAGRQRFCRQLTRLSGQVDWLAEHFDDPKLAILDVRYYARRPMTVGHAPRAIMMQRWGINDDSTIVVYDDLVAALPAR